MIEVVASEPGIGTAVPPCLCFTLRESMVAYNGEIVRSGETFTLTGEIVGRACQSATGLAGFAAATVLVILVEDGSIAVTVRQAGDSLWVSSCVRPSIEEAEAWLNHCEPKGSCSSAFLALVREAALHQAREFLSAHQSALQNMAA